MKTMTILMVIFATVTVRAQNIDILTLDDTITVNSQTVEVVQNIYFVNNSPSMRAIAVYELPIVELPGTEDTVGYFASWSPLPSEPEYLDVEPYDTLQATYRYKPNGQTGVHHVSVCFYDYTTPGDTTCTTLTVITDQYANIDKHNTMQIYPNPTSTYFTITSSLHESWALFDMYGNLVQLGVIDQYNTRVEMSGLQAGVYFLNLVGADHMITTKKVVKK